MYLCGSYESMISDLNLWLCALYLNVNICSVICEICYICVICDSVINILDMNFQEILLKISAENYVISVIL